jgi:hypothetical protein
MRKIQSEATAMTAAIFAIDAFPEKVIEAKDRPQEKETQVINRLEETHFRSNPRSAHC